MFSLKSFYDRLPRQLQWLFWSVLSIFFIFLAWIFLEPLLEKEKLMTEPCNPSTVEMQCYVFSRENCTTVWNRYNEICKDEVKKRMDPNRPTSLLGPTIRVCTYKKFDMAFGTTRRLEPSERCKAHFAEMDSPSMIDY